MYIDLRADMYILSTTWRFSPSPIQPNSIPSNRSSSTGWRAQGGAVQ